jgi:hypothetical protein
LQELADIRIRYCAADRNRKSALAALAFLSKKGGPEREPEGTPGGLRHLRNPKFVSIALRLFSLALILAALLLLCIDMLSSLESGGRLTVRSLEQVWALADSASLAQTTAWLKFHGGLAEWTTPLLALPGWGVTGVLGVLIAFLAGRHPEH